MKVPFDNLTLPNSRINFCSINNNKKKERKKERETKKKLIGSLSFSKWITSFQLNPVHVFLHLAGWVKIKYLHLIRWEMLSRPLQDCAPVRHWSWNRVVRAQACIWVHDILGIKINDEVSSKLWTIIWIPVNCLSCLFWLYLTQKRCQPFKIVERKDKRVGGFAISTTGFR